MIKVFLSKILRWFLESGNDDAYAKAIEDMD